VSPTTRGTSAGEERLRADRWLWCVRLFKSRGLAAAAVKAGHVRLDGARIKAARELRVGDQLLIVRGDEELELTVTGIPARRGPAAEARSFYSETEASAVRRRTRAELKTQQMGLEAPTPGRPDKRTRRLIRSRQRDFSPR
jgi:ribosome-associated heat shock protein Hsp15